MNWTTPADLRAQVQRLWDRGDLLRAALPQAPPGAWPTSPPPLEDGLRAPRIRPQPHRLSWPLRLTLKVPTAADLSDRFEEARDWVRSIAETPHVRIEWREWNHRVQGAQRLPAAAWMDTPEAALDVLGKARQARRFQTLWQRTSDVQPALLPWLSRRPLQALDLADRWERLLSVVAWLQAHPRPVVYLRQVDAPGVDSKFIEAHKGVLTELLDLALPDDAIDDHAVGAAQFARRFGFLDKPVRIRFRTLDPALPRLPGCPGLPDTTLDAASFAALALPIERVFVTENETNFLAFPPVPQAMVVFGAGYGWEWLADAAWLHRCPVHYWGDIDTHGFVILDRLRGYLPHAASFLMDRQTLLAHRLHWGEEPEPAQHDLPRLTTEEAVVYDDLRYDRLRPRLRLEQERVGFGWLIAQLCRSW